MVLMDFFSAIREIPDHQEVFCNKDADQSIIFDILEGGLGLDKAGRCPRLYFSLIIEYNFKQK